MYFWCYGPFNSWCYGSLNLWRYGSFNSWCYGSLCLWRYGSFGATALQYLAPCFWRSSRGGCRAGFAPCYLAKYSTAVAGGFFIGYELGGRKSSKRSGNMSCNIKRTCSIALHYVCLLLCCVSIYAAQYSTVFVLRYVHTYNVRSTIYITATAYCIRCGLYCAV